MTLRWGLVTAGKICHDFANAFNSYPDMGDQVIAAVASRDKSRAIALAEIYNIAKVFDSYQAMAASKDIDIAYIGAINPDHYELTKLYLENDKHVLCEKPMCLNYKQTASLIRLAKRKNLFLMEAVWSRFSPTYLAFEEEMNSGKLGDVKHVEVNFGIPIEHIDRLRLKKLGGSAILDLGIYVLQFAQLVFKEEPIKVTATGEVNEEGVDVVDTVILDYKGGKKAVLNVNTKLKLWNKATVYGNKGRITLEEPFNFPETLIRVDGTVAIFPLHVSNIPYYFKNSAGLVYETIEVARCIKQGFIESPRMSHEESLLLAKLEDEVRKQVGVHFDADDIEYP